MACPACGCKECYQYNGWGDGLDDTEGWERCAACGAIFPEEEHTPEDETDVTTTPARRPQDDEAFDCEDQS